MTKFLVLACALLYCIDALPDDVHAELQRLRDPSKLNVHIVSHTHDDVGWLKTVDQYYNGQNNSIQWAAVRAIIDAVVHELSVDSNRKFSYVEQAFFQRWWREADSASQTNVKTLVKNGQLVFLNGGWSMHDEAATHYVDMVDQTTLGHRFLLEEFGAVPRIGWQIDPFGHSATQAALLSAGVGFEGLFFGRIDYQDRAVRVDENRTEFLWDASPSLGSHFRIFTGAMDGYGPPGEFDWDIHLSAQTINDNPKLEDYNVPDIVNSFVSHCLTQANNTIGDIFIPFGSDFQYAGARWQFQNIDKLIKAVNADGRINTFYSNPELYVASKQALNYAWTTKTDDFFPYADCPHCFWTGYFVSRAALKRYVRSTSSYFTAVRQIAAVAGDDTALDRLSKLSEALGVCQHHDAVAGTAKQHVAFDYALRLAHGYELARSVFSDGLKTLSGSSTDFTLCPLLNVSVCSPSQAADSFVVTAWNPIGYARHEIVRVPVGSSGPFEVTDLSSGTSLDVQVVPCVSSITNYNQQNGDGAVNCLLFNGSVPAIGWNSFLVKKKTSDVFRQQSSYGVRESDDNIVLDNNILQVTFNKANGLMTSIVNKQSGVSLPITQDWAYYVSFVGGKRDGKETGESSGAYIFRSESNVTHMGKMCNQSSDGRFCIIGGTAQLTVNANGNTLEVTQQFSSWVYQTVRLNPGARHVEIEYTVGPIPVGDDVGKEVVSRFATGLATSGRFYTDSNGREIQTRRRDYRPTWNLTQTEEVAGNYYPINSAAYIKDDATQLTVLVDASQGGGSIVDGEMEIMVHRRVLADDHRGVGEPLNETQFTDHSEGTGLIIRGIHYVTVEPPASAASQWRPLQDRIFSPFQLAFTAGDAKIATPSGSGLKVDLPANVQLMTLERLAQGRTLVRLAHQFGVGEDAALSEPVTVDFGSLFSNVPAAHVTEVSLTANQPASAIANLFRWKSQTEPNYRDLTSTDNSTTTIGPMEIKTFVFSN